MEVAVIFLSYFMRKGFSRQKLNGVWNSMGYWRIHNFIRVFVDGEEFKIDKYRFEKNKGMYVRCNGKDFYLSDLYGDHGKCRAVMNNHKIEIFTHQNEFNQFIVQNKGYRYKVQLNRYENPSSINAKRKDRMDGEQIVMSPLHGKIYKIHASETLQVKKGDVLMVIEAMKMENRILAPEDGKLEHILVKEGQQVSEDTPLVKLRFTA
jgi:biotin carboxyl carrier protein